MILSLQYWPSLAFERAVLTERRSTKGSTNSPV